ncbi:MAG: hypothetical protein Q9227_004063 [Pyrenula ochraceoflavens]
MAGLQRFNPYEYDNKRLRAQPPENEQFERLENYFETGPSRSSSSQRTTRSFSSHSEMSTPSRPANSTTSHQPIDLPEFGSQSWLNAEELKHPGFTSRLVAQLRDVLSDTTLRRCAEDAKISDDTWPQPLKIGNDSTFKQCFDSIEKYLNDIINLTEARDVGQVPVVLVSNLMDNIKSLIIKSNSDHLKKAAELTGERGKLSQVNDSLKLQLEKASGWSREGSNTRPPSNAFTDSIFSSGQDLDMANTEITRLKEKCQMLETEKDNMRLDHERHNQARDAECKAKEKFFQTTRNNLQKSLRSARSPNKSSPTPLSTVPNQPNRKYASKREKSRAAKQRRRQRLRDAAARQT